MNASPIDYIPTTAGIWTAVVMVLGIISLFVARAMSAKDKGHRARRKKLDEITEDMDMVLRGDNRADVLDVLRRAARLRK